MDTSFLPILLLGFTLDVEHALDSDHIVAISTIVNLIRRPLRAVLVCAFWGIGHTLTLLLVGLAVIIFKLVIPFQLALSMEFLVGVVLVILGAQILWKYRIKKVHSHPHFTHYRYIVWRPSSARSDWWQAWLV